MTYLIYGVIILSLIRCVSFGVYTFKKRNISGGIAVLVLAAISAVAGFTVIFY